MFAAHVLEMVGVRSRISGHCNGGSRGRGVVVTVIPAACAVIIISRDGRPVSGAAYTFGIEATANHMSKTATMNDEERELAELIVTALNLEIPAADIQPEAPLYGEGLGLDSIDILEIALAVSKRYGVQIRSDDSENVQIFTSLRSLSEHVQQQRPA